MKYLINRSAFSTMLLAFLLCFSFAFSSCSEEKNDPSRESDPTILALGEQVRSLSEFRDAQTYGDLKGEYRESSKAIIDNTRLEINRLILDYDAGKITETNEALIARTKALTDKAIADFKATVRLEDAIKTIYAAELLVKGEDNGYIDFGSSPNFTNFGTPGDQAFTIELWVKLAKTAGFGAILSTFLENGDADPRFRSGWMFNHFNNDFMRMSYGLTGYGLWEPGDGFREVDQWRHIAAVYNDKGVDGEVNAEGKPKVIKLYFDGVEVRSTENGNPGTEYYNYKSTDDASVPMTAFLQIGKSGDKDRKINGSIKDFHIWKSAKSSEDLNKIMNKEIEVTGAETDLVCGWTFDRTVKNNQAIVDLTGKYNAKLEGDYEWDVDKSTVLVPGEDW